MGNNVLVGCPRDDLGGINVGAVYLFEGIPESVIPGDFNEDGNVDAIDFAHWQGVEDARANA